MEREVIPGPKEPCTLDNYKSWYYWKKLNLQKVEMQEKTYKFYNEMDKCETPYQELAFINLFRFFPDIKVEKWFWNKDNSKRWRVDIIIGNIVIEIDGSHHRFNDDQFNKDEEKDTFLFKKGYYVLRRSNEWVLKHFKILPEIVLEFMNNNREKIRR